MNISFIGFGNIAQAMSKSLLNQVNYNLRAAAPSLPIGVNKGVHTHSNNLAVLKDADIVILAVKPRHAAEVLTEIKHNIPPHCLLISVAAGLPLAWLEKHCAEKQAIVRAMPNIPIAVNQGATPLIANQEVREEQFACAEELFQHMGIINWVTHEADMDIFTALSGSGPAYVFLFMEAMMQAAEQLGLQADVAKAFVLQTIKGAVSLADASELPVHELRTKVTSEGGTTAAAISIFKNAKFERIVLDAMDAACARAKELANEIGNKMT